MFRTFKQMCGISRRLFHRSPYSVDIPECSLTDFIFKDLERHAKCTALINGQTGETKSFEQLRSEVANVAGNLHQLGVGHGDTICLCGTNVPEFAHVILGVTATGAALTIANFQLTPGELIHQMTETDSKYLMITPDCAEKARAIKQAMPSLSEVIVLGEAENFRPFSSLLRKQSELPNPKIDVRNHVALLPYSSGTTGLPKGVELTHRNLVAELCALRHKLFLPLQPDKDTSLSALPMVHIAGMVIGMLNPLSQGATVVTLPRFEPNTYLQVLQKYKATFALIAPPVVNFFAHHPLVDKYDLSSLHTPYSGAAALGKDLTEKMIQRLNLRGIRQGYGMSETSPATHTSPLDGWKYGSVGKPLPNTDSKVVCIQSGETLGPYENGEIWVRGPQVMKGYRKNDQETKSTITDQGWLKTGDIGYYDEDGHYFIVDRLKEIIKYKGYQIAPAYLESVLLKHSDVQDAAVIGIPDEIGGEVPRAYVVTRTNVQESELIQFVNSQVAPYKKLRGGLQVVSELPRSPSGKILRRKLLEHFNNVGDSQKTTQSLQK